MSDDANALTASGASAAEENDSRRYWRAAISHLSDLQKRDAAWEFYLRKMEGRKSSDTISGLVLVLEANSIFLEHLPERYQQQLIAPSNRQIEGLQRLFDTREERERAALANSEEIARSNLSTTNRAVAAAETIERALREAATAIDAQAVSREIKGQIEEKALKPFARTLEELATRSGQMEQAATAAEQSIAKWRKVHLGGIVLCSAFLVAGFSVYISKQWQRRCEQALALEVHRVSENDKVRQELLLLGITLKVLPWVDEHGRPVSNGHVLVVEDAEAANLQEAHNRKDGAIFVKSGSALRRIEYITEQLEKAQQR